MPLEPASKRTIAFFDGQNLFYAAKHAFGYSWPNYDPLALARSICKLKKCWDLCETYFYTGIPSIIDDSFWHHFWSAKLAVMGTRKIHTFARNLKYRNQTVNLLDGTTTTVLVG
jgi:hypothetical protein